MDLKERDEVHGEREIKSAISLEAVCEKPDKKDGENYETSKNSKDNDDEHDKSEIKSTISLEAVSELDIKDRNLESFIILSKDSDLEDKDHDVIKDREEVTGAEQKNEEEKIDENTSEAPRNSKDENLEDRQNKEDPEKKIEVKQQNIESSNKELPEKKEYEDGEDQQKITSTEQEKKENIDESVLDFINKNDYHFQNENLENQTNPEEDDCVILEDTAEENMHQNDCLENMSEFENEEYESGNEEAGPSGYIFVKTALSGEVGSDDESPPTTPIRRVSEIEVITLSSDSEEENSYLMKRKHDNEEIHNNKRQQLEESENILEEILNEDYSSEELNLFNEKDNIEE